MADKSAQKYVEHLPQFLAWLTATGLEHKLNLSTVVQCAEEDLPLKGKRFVMSGFRDKTLAATLIAKGAVQSSSVSKTTWALIVNDIGDETGKVLDAKRNNVRIFTSAEIKEFY
jgi:NAD-dependent DNA ligase